MCCRAGTPRRGIKNHSSCEVFFAWSLHCFSPITIAHHVANMIPIRYDADNEMDHKEYDTEDTIMDEETTKNVDDKGNISYRDTEGKLHRNDGPAAMLRDGTMMWSHHGDFHREDKPSITWEDGSQRWYYHGKLHREDGPAVVNVGGKQAWYVHGEQHREDGPAVIYGDGSQEWWMNGERIR